MQTMFDFISLFSYKVSVILEVSFIHIVLAS